MPIPTQVEAAEWILDFAVHERGVRPGEVAMNQWYFQPLAAKRWRVEDYREGLIYAANQLWIEAGPNDTVKITQAGYDHALTLR